MILNVYFCFRDGGFATAAVPKALSPPAPMASSPQNNHHGEHHAVTGVNSSSMSMDDTSDEFDPRGFTPGKKDIFLTMWLSMK